ncbi:hypothetical protein [Jiulongibacter sp. NS-SX5]|uniref:hypothetical protein n=1 Tax=Jiulongibacter sp. NS-SX5 TaxID=3463854 RepID=UPI004058ABD0
MIEVKSYTSKTIPTGVSLGKGYGSFQMMGVWIDQLMRRYKASTNSQLRQSGELIDHMIKNKEQLIEKYIVQIDYLGNAAVVRVN